MELTSDHAKVHQNGDDFLEGRKRAKGVQIPCTVKSWKVLVPLAMDATLPSSGRVSWLPLYTTWQVPAYSASPWLP